MKPVGKKPSVGPSSPANNKQISISQSSGLTPPEREFLKSYEEVLQRGLGTFFEVGNALIAIRDARLYRVDYETFDAYCHERWGIGRTYAWRVIGAAERLRLLPPGDQNPRPTSEFQMRPFLKLRPEAFPPAWQKIVAKSKGGLITSEKIRQLVAEFAPEGNKQARADCRPRRVRLSKRCGAGEVLMLLQEARHRIETGQAEQAIESLERMERLLFEG